MVINVIIIVLLVLTATTVVNTVELYTKNNNVSFKEAMELLEFPIVTIKTQDKALKFVIDTGCTNSCINASTINNLGITPTNVGNSHYGIDGNKVDLLTCNLGFSLKRKSYNFDFNVADMDKVFDCIKESNGVQIHGLIGSDFLSKYNYVIDYKDCILYKK